MLQNLKSKIRFHHHKAKVQMDFQKAKILSQKINRHLEIISLDNKISSIERDLMLQYIREFYEIFLNETDVPSPKVEKKLYTPPPTIVPPPPKPKPKPVIVEPPKPKKVSPPPPVVKAPPPVVEKPKPTPVYVPPPKPKPAPKKALNAEQEELFEYKEAKEISEKLSQSKIKDLNKAMGINDKLHYINELFGKDNKAFDQAITALNGLNSFEEAKVFISEKVALKYDWTNKQKKKKAMEFIKLVRRRYD